MFPSQFMQLTALRLISHEITDDIDVVVEVD